MHQPISVRDDGVLFTATPDGAITQSHLTVPKLLELAKQMLHVAICIDSTCQDAAERAFDQTTIFARRSDEPVPVSTVRLGLRADGVLCVTAPGGAVTEFHLTPELLITVALDLLEVANHLDPGCKDDVWFILANAKFSVRGEVAAPAGRPVGLH